MISLDKWFSEKSKKPLITASIVIVVAQICLITFGLYQKDKSQTSGIENIVSNMATLGIEQSNRNLIESAVEMAIEELGVNKVLICNGEETEYSYPFGVSRCDNPPKVSSFEKLIAITPSGFSQYKMSFYANRLHGAMPYLWVIALSLVFLGFVLVKIFTVQQVFKDEIISPIEKRLLSNEAIAIKELEDLRQKIAEQTEAHKAKAKASVIMNHKKSLSHNIRSRVHSLKGVYSDIKDLISEGDRKALESLIRSFTSMTNKLTLYVGTDSKQEYLTEATFFEAMKSANKQKALVNVADLLRSSADLKGIEISESKKSSVTINLKCEEENIFSSLTELEFLSILSNIMNNSVEAGATEINIDQHSDDDTIQINIADNGKGVPKEVASSLFDFGETSGKENGTGYGLFHAKEFLKSWGGSIALVNTDSSGTEFQITIPKWQHQNILLKASQVIAILDDDETIHQDWKKITKDNKDLTLKIFYDGDAFSSWVSTANVDFDNLICFVDNDLGENKTTGSELIESLGINSVSSLVTNRFDDPDLIEFCEEHKIDLIPKPLIHTLVAVL